MCAGISTLQALKSEAVWRQLEAATAMVVSGIGKLAEEQGIPVQQTQVGTMFCTFFTETPVRDWTTVATSDTVRFARFFREMLRNGVYLPPSQFEACFLSTAHGDEEIRITLEAAKKALAALR
jgi:glutamate-1-semialdehyde 2,1-aminomutase